MAAVNRLLSLLVGLALVGAGAIALVEIILAAFGHGFVLIPATSWLSTLRHTAWDALAVEEIMGAIGILGLLLVLYELAPRRPRWLACVIGGRRVELSRRPTEAYLQRRVKVQTPATRARAEIHGRPSRWRVDLRVTSTEAVAAEVEAAARAACARLSSSPPRRVRVRVARRARVA